MQNAFFKHYGFRILVVVFFLLPFIWMGTKRTFLSNSNNVADWLPDKFIETKDYNWYLKNFPYERFVVVSWNGCTMDDSRLEMFAQKLVPGQTIDNIAKWADEQLRAELALEGNDTAPPAAQPPVKKPENDAQNDTAAEKESIPTVNYFKSVITGPRLYRLFKEIYSGDGLGAIKLTDEQIRRKMQGLLIGPDGNSTALIVTLTKEAPQGKALAEVLETIRKIGRECGVQARIPEDNRLLPVKICHNIAKIIQEMIYGRHPDMSGCILGGPPVDNVAITHEGEQTLQRLAGLCGLIGLGLAWLCFRDFRLTFFVFWMAIISAGVALACVSLTGGTCDAILLSMPALIYVLAMSGAIHLINYYHDAIREEGLDLAPERAVGHAWSPCFFANFTTALGLVSLYASHLVPITKFGVYSALGVMLQLVLLFYYLPTLLYFYPSHKVAAEKTLTLKADDWSQKWWRFWGGLMIKTAIPVTLLCGGAMIYYGYGLSQIKTSVKMMSFFSPDSEIIAHYKWLEEHLGPLVPMEIVVKFDNERCNMLTIDRLRLVTEIDEALRDQLGEYIGGVLSAETMTPPLPAYKQGTRKGTSVIVRERAMNKALDKGRNELRDYITTEGSRSLLRDDTLYKETLQQLGITDADAQRLCSVGITDTKKLVNSPQDRQLGNISSEEFENYRDKAIQWEREHGTDLWRISLRVWSLKKNIDYSKFINDVKEVVAPIVAQANKEMLNEKTADDSCISAVYTGMVPVVYKTQHELMTGLRNSFVSSFVLIAAVMAFILRTPGGGWLSTLLGVLSSASALITFVCIGSYGFITDITLIGISCLMIILYSPAGFLAMIPNLFPVIIVFGFMGQYGILVDVGTMMTASVALGISVDDTIHFLTWFRHALDKQMSRKDATLYAYSRCANAMVQTTLIAGFGLSAFALSTFTPTQMFGIMMLAILCTASFGDLVFLAAMVNTPIGKVFDTRKKQEQSSKVVID